MNTAGEKTISLALETSGRIGSVAVARGGAILAAEEFSTCNGHGVELLPTADRICRRACLTAESVEQVYVSGGPGSFTGLRIGITFAKAMAMAVGAKVVRVPTLDVIAQNALGQTPPPARVVVVLDAKRKNIYSAAFEFDGAAYVPIDEPDERDPNVYLPALGPVAALGEGIGYHADAVTAVTSLNVLPDALNRARAEVVFELGRQRALTGDFIDIDALTPIYIRKPEAEEKWDQRHGSVPR